MQLFFDFQSNRLSFSLLSRDGLSRVGIFLFFGNLSTRKSAQSDPADGNGKDPKSKVCSVFAQSSLQTFFLISPFFGSLNKSEVEEAN